MYNLSARVVQDYTASLRNHIKYVQDAGKILNGKYGHPVISYHQLDTHDASKWSPEEFPAYAEYFHGTRTDEVISNFAKAWLHHQHMNQHHWQHWVLIQDDADDSEYGTPQGGKVALQMPENYALEMIADWMGASKAYTGSWDMSEWLEGHWDGLILHEETRKFVGDVLTLELGYDLD